MTTTTPPRPDTVDGKIHDLYQIVTTVDGRVRSVQESLDAFRRQADRRFDTVDDRLGRLESDVAALKSDVVEVKTQVAKLPEIEAQVAKLPEILGLVRQLAGTQETN